MISLELIAALSSPILAIWNSWQAYQIKKLEMAYNNLCSGCEYTYTPKNKINNTAEIPPVY